MMAVANYNECLRINPTIADAYWNRAALRAMRARYKLATQDYLRYSKIMKNDPQPHLLIGQLYEEKFDDAQLLVRAMDHYEKYLELGGTNSTILAKVRMWKDLKKSAGVKDNGGKKEEGKGPGKKKETGPRLSDDEAALKLFDLYKKLMLSGDPADRAKVPGVIKEMLDKYPHTKLVKEKRRFLEIIRDSLTGDDEKKPDDK